VMVRAPPSATNSRSDRNISPGRHMIGSMSLVHSLVVAIILAVLLVPVARILRRAGFSPWWSIMGGA
jgi:hypothetical protein